MVRWSCFFVPHFAEFVSNVSSQWTTTIFSSVLDVSTEALARPATAIYSNDHYATVMQGFFQVVAVHLRLCATTASGCEVKGVKFLRHVVYSICLALLV